MITKRKRPASASIARALVVAGLDVARQLAPPARDAVAHLPGPVAPVAGDPRRTRAAAHARPSRRRPRGEHLGQQRRSGPALELGEDPEGTVGREGGQRVDLEEVRLARARRAGSRRARSRGTRAPRRRAARARRARARGAASSAPGQAVAPAAGRRGMALERVQADPRARPRARAAARAARAAGRCRRR